ncbi:MAG TPA: response regulator [Verrucomicrobiae bacterium]|jgi:CheY-like chemotaxis protein|nr:response regulator [Verrucomicrobiae bacterium]
MSAKKTILVAEDDSNDIYLLKLAFLKAHLNVHFDFVQDGEQLIKYLASRDCSPEHPLPELLLLDIKMPKINGFEALEWIRRQPGLKRLLIVMLTSSDEPRDINRAYDLGANSYLVKPCGMEHLIDIAEHLNKYWLNLNRMPDCGPRQVGSESFGKIRRIP